MSQQAKAPIEVKATKRATSETVFKTINILLLSLLAFCIKGFLEFRSACIDRGLYVFSLSSLKWCLVGFIARYVFLSSLR